MTKIRAPLFSLRAHGSLDNSLTIVQRKGQAVAMKIPTHPDARSLPQLYQRWRFIDAKYYWASLTGAQQEAYRAAANTARLPLWAYFLRTYLPNPPDQVAWWHLDDPSGPTARDFSGKGNHATIFGAAPDTGIIAGARYFDRIDDYLSAPSSTTLNFIETAQYTFLGWIRLASLPSSHPSHYTILNKGTGTNGWALRVTPPSNKLDLVSYQGGMAHLANTALVALTWYQYAVLYDNRDIYFYLNAVADGSHVPGNVFNDDTTSPLLISAPDHTFHGIHDDPRIYNRLLTLEHIDEILRTQRYPQP